MGLGGLIPLSEWDRKARAGLVSEPAFDLTKPNTGIECPNRDGLRNEVCRAHLWDLPFVEVFYYDEKGRVLRKNFFRLSGKPYRKERRRAVGCKVCGWSGSRVIAR